MATPQTKHEEIQRLYDRSIDPTLTTKQMRTRVEDVINGMSQKELNEAGSRMGARSKPVTKEALIARVMGRRGAFVRANDAGAYDPRWTVQSTAAELTAGEITPEQASRQIRNSIHRTNLGDNQLLELARQSGVPSDTIARAESVGQKGPLVVRGKEGLALRGQLEDAVHAKLLRDVHASSGTPSSTPATPAGGKPVAAKPKTAKPRKPKAESHAAKAIRLLTPPAGASPEVATAFERARRVFEDADAGSFYDTPRSVADALVSPWLHHTKQGDAKTAAAFEPVLQALGAVRHGEPGQVVPFDGRVHEAEVGVSDSQPVRVTRHGWQMAGDRGPPLQRTLVEPV